MRLASIDIGSNSCVLLIAEIDESKKEELYFDSIITALGKEIKKGQPFNNKSFDDTVDALENFASVIKKFNISPDEVIVTATEASRLASNASELFETIYSKTNLRTSIISAKDEAYFTAQGVCEWRNDNHTKKLSLIDQGGASTEIISCNTDPFKLNDFVSLPIGSVRAKGWIDDETFGDRVAKLAPLIDLSLKKQCYIGVAGTLTTLARVDLNMSEVLPSLDGHILYLESLKKIERKLKPLNTQEILELYPYVGKRAEVLYSGCKTMCWIMETLEINQIETSLKGLRHGTIIDLYKKLNA